MTASSVAAPTPWHSMSTLSKSSAPCAAIVTNSSSSLSAVRSCSATRPRSDSMSISHTSSSMRCPSDRLNVISDGDTSMSRIGARFVNRTSATSPVCSAMPDADTGT
jgi:hypothetical protein